MIGNNMKSKIRRILKEDIHQMMLDKIIKMVKLPYYDFLRKNGISDDDTEMVLTKLFKDKFGDGEVNVIIKDGYSGFIYLDVEMITKMGDKEILYKEAITNNSEVFWTISEKKTHFDRFGDSNVFTYRINSVGNKNYCWTQDNTCYDNYDKNNWDKISQWADKLEIFNMK
jgi:hypothetical protein